MERILSSRNISNPGSHMAVGFNRICTEILFSNSSRKQSVGQVVDDRIVVFLENSAPPARIIWSSSLIPIRIKWEHIARLNIRTRKIKLQLITFLYRLFVVLLEQSFKRIFQRDTITEQGSVGNFVSGLFIAEAIRKGCLYLSEGKYARSAPQCKIQLFPRRIPKFPCITRTSPPKWHHSTGLLAQLKEKHS